MTNVTCLGLGVFSGILTARMLGPTGRGELAVLNYFPALMASLFTMGIPEALGYLVSKEKQRQEYFIAAGTHVAMVLGVFGAFTFALIAPLTLSEDKASLATIVSATCLLAPAMTINPSLWAMHRAIGRFDWVNSLLVIGSSAWLLLLIFIWWTGAVSASTIVWAGIGLQMTLTVLNVWRIGFTSIIRRPPTGVYRQEVVQGLRFFAPALVQMIYLATDRALLMRVSSLSELGNYSVAMTIAYSLALGPEAIAQIAFVEVSGTANEERRHALVIRRFQMTQIVVAGSALTMLLALPYIMRYAFGATFLSALPVAYWMVGVMAFRGLNKSLEFSLRAMNMVWPGIVAGLLGFSVLVPLGVAWSSSGGVKGFAQAYCCSEMAFMTVLAVALCLKAPSSWTDLWGLRPSTFATVLRGFRSLRRRESDHPCDS